MAHPHALRPRFHLTDDLGAAAPMLNVYERWFWIRYSPRNTRYLGARISITTAGSGLVGVTEEEYYDGETAATYYPAETVWFERLGERLSSRPGRPGDF
jgi:hypothetical protein